MPVDPQALADQLSHQYGHLLPPTLIVATLQAAGPPRSSLSPETGRADVDALAQAALRRSVAGS